MVLWGKSKDEPTSESIGKRVLASENEHMTEMNENISTSNRDLLVVAVDGARGRNTEESV